MLRRPRESCGGASAAASCCAQLPAAGRSSSARAGMGIYRARAPPVPEKKWGSKRHPLCRLPAGAVRGQVSAPRTSLLLASNNPSDSVRVESGSVELVLQERKFRHVPSSAAACRSARYYDHAVQWNWCCVQYVRSYVLLLLYLCRGRRPE